MMVEQEDETRAIQDMDRVQQFLGDAAVKAAIARVDAKNRELFEAAKTTDEIVAAHSRALLLSAIVAELGVTIAKGEFHKAARDRRGPQKKS